MVKSHHRVSLYCWQHPGPGVDVRNCSPVSSTWWAKVWGASWNKIFQPKGPRGQLWSADSLIVFVSAYKNSAFNVLVWVADSAVKMTFVCWFVKYRCWSHQCLFPAKLIRVRIIDLNWIKQQVFDRCPSFLWNFSHSVAFVMCCPSVTLTLTLLAHIDMM